MRIAFGILAAFAAACATPSRQPRAPAAGTPSFEVMTYNVNFGIAGDPSTLSAIKGEQADLVVLQETTPEWEESLRAELSDEYPHMAFRHAAGAGGVAALSKSSIQERELIEPPNGGWFPAWRLEVSSPIGRVQVLCVHLRPQLSERGSFVSGYFTTPGVRLAEISTYFARLDTEQLTLVVGDFNEGRGGLAIGYLERRGFTSALGEFGSQPTWRWPTSVGTISAELDHVVYGPKLEPLSVRVVKAGRSDHLPVVARFAVRRDPVP
jgi:endonuclease/exonuclease/phosphatase (EEP) superfamily protein YafD